MQAFSEWSRTKWSTSPFVFALVLFPASATHASSRPTEHEVKAVFLYHFAKYVEWPPEAFEDPEEELTIGVIGDEEFTAILQRTIENERVSHKHLVARSIDRDEDCFDCDIVFISSTVSESHALLERTRGRSVLTVGESDGFAQAGGIIGFFLEQSHVRFEINVDAAASAELTISSQLLKLAEIVRWERD